MALLLCSSAAALVPNGALLASAPRPALLRSSNVRSLAGGPELVDGLDAAAQLPSVLLAAREQTEEAIKAAAGELGWWGTYIKTVEDGILTLHDKLEDFGVPFPYGTAIFCFVLGVKLVTLPLNWNQLSSSAQMKSIKPQQDLVTEWYQDNKQMQNMATADLFEKLDVNPLAGCLPSLAQIPVFLGVYYSVTSIAKAKVFSEPFLWIPNLSGPIADRREGISWLTENWVDGHPPLGWEDTLAYLTLPAILVCTQTAALYLLGSFDAIDETKKETQSVALVLRVLPLMLGWFAMNAPSGLGLYWVFNNILTTSQTVLIKKLVEKDEVAVAVDLATLGPRREPLPMVANREAPDWVKAASTAEGSVLAETADKAKVEAIGAETAESS